MTRTGQEITIHGEFEVTDDLIERICDFIEENFDCELYAVGRRPAPRLRPASLENDYASGCPEHEHYWCTNH